jgi:AcrR family transcriptional regulator
VPRRTAEDAAATRAHLLAVARRAFADRGYGATTLDGIATEAGVTRGAVHHHFGDKRAMFLEVFRQVEDELNPAIITAARGAPNDPIEQLRAGCRALFAAFGGTEYRQVALGDAPAVLGLLEWYEVDRSFGMATMRAGLEAMAGAGLLPRERVPAATVLLYGALTEAALHLQAAGGRDGRDGLGDLDGEVLLEAVEAMLAGLGAPAPR